MLGGGVANRQQAALHLQVTHTHHATIKRKHHKVKI